PGDVQGYTSALAAADQAREAGRKYGSEYGLAGSGANPVSGEQGFNAALAYGAHGGDYKTLGEWLTGVSQQSPQAELGRGNIEGMQIYQAHHGPQYPPDREPMPPGSSPPGRHNGGGGEPAPAPRPGGGGGGEPAPAPRPNDHR